ncbi:molybdenum cofactor biosynthesis protein MoaE [Helicobacter sp. MIT 14-3879]|uniref:molybdopterin synthase catalytic subunit n=1 Tax=Helicobacter sp. MIT 14-3879 TaxID=2040649 RepID=UPI000E1F4F9D|nr:molybdenum cofactor biosynthesis protein MoaE [Helicobacter sp. MIT 14-3879]RDU64774.1 molybdenum cofactor biosynthesis protein MoaE [Helicobacter sp. MIT 14-3879]
MLEISNGAIDANKYFNIWEEHAKISNFGAYSVFVGVVRGENGISALSFEIYLPLLQKWFSEWLKKAKENNAKIYMAHSNGNVEVGKVSFMCAVISKNRKISLELYEKFIEDFKANAPIWKYDIKNGKKIYAKERSKAIKGAGILYDKNS